MFTGRESSGQLRIAGRNSAKVSQSLQDSEKQLRQAEEKRARRAARNLEMAERFAVLPNATLQAVLDANELEMATNAELETINQGPDQ